MNTILRKCKSLSKLGRTSSYSSLRSKYDREAMWGEEDSPIAADCNGGGVVAVLVGGSRRRYMVKPEQLNHPLLAALVDRRSEGMGDEIRVRCEVVLFDHLLWVLGNADAGDAAEDVAELAQLYAC